MSSLNPVTREKEFSGTPGALAIAFGLPAVIVAFAYVCNEEYLVQGITIDVARISAQLPTSWSEVAALAFDKASWAAYLGWFFSMALLDVYAPGKHLKGTKLVDGTYLDYKINGPFVLSLLLVILAARAFQADNFYLPELEFLYTHQTQLTVVTILFSLLLSVFVYVCSFIPLQKPNGIGTKERILSPNGNSDSAIYNWFIGRELNPRIGSWDIKLFCELKPGLLLWFLINLACLHHQYQTLGKVSDSLVLVNALEALYIFDGVLNEAGLLSMIDIVTDGFGYMLAFGDLAWVPWSYTLQARYLALPENYLHLGEKLTLLIIVLNVLGFYIFRASNQQKADFKAGKLDHLKLISTPTGSRLLVDGWWGLSQHINYFGDWLIGWSWCLPTGFQTPLTYFFVVYFGSLLIHRQTRDEAKCAAKYGEAWKRYTREVPYKIIPYVY